MAMETKVTTQLLDGALPASGRLFDPVADCNRCRTLQRPDVPQVATQTTSRLVVRVCLGCLRLTHEEPAVEASFQSNIRKEMTEIGDAVIATQSGEGLEQLDAFFVQRGWRAHND